MTIFNVGAWRPANGEARAAQLTAANDLVQRTLAQHGLMPHPDADPNTPNLPQFPKLDTVLAGLGKMPQPVIPEVPLPHPGAEFRQGNFSCSAGARDFRTYVPSTASNGVTGLVVMLHGCTQTPEDFAAGTRMNGLAEEHGFVVIYPRQSRGDNAQSCWNWFSRGDQRRDRGEPAILAGMTREVMAEFDVPSDRTFVAGLSAGAAMAVILGDAYPDVFAAIGAHSGLPFGAARDVPSAFAAMGGAAEPTTRRVRDANAVRSIIIHGSADGVVHPSNGEMIVRDVLDSAGGPTLETVERNAASGRNFTRQIMSGQDGATIAEHWIIEGLGHSWSGGDATGSHTDASGPDASAEMIRFFFQPHDEDC